jgi:hypothetical protein
MTGIMKRHSFIAALICAAAVSACGDEALTNITEPLSGGSRIRFFHFGVLAPGVNFYANDTKMTAIATTVCSSTTPIPEACTTTGSESTTGLAYSAVSAAGAYSAIAPGQYTLTGRIAAATDKDLPIATVATTLEDGKFYSYYMSGIYNTTAKTSDAFVVEDPLALPPDFGTASVRLVHAISNANPMTLYARDTVTLTEVAVGGEVAYKGAGTFTTIPAGVYNLSTRYAGASTNALTRPAITFLGGRVYTISARGDITVAPSTACAAANRTCLDFTANFLGLPGLP